MPHADLLLHDARILTMDQRRPLADAVAVKDGRILAVGAYSDLQSLAGGGAKSLDCRGRCLLPGFIDAHLHFSDLAAARAGIDCSPGSVRSISDLRYQIKIRAAALPPGQWIRGYGYDEFHLAEKRHPDRRDLDEVSPSNPVRLIHRSLHAQVLNSRALKQAGISSDTEEPPGGIIDRDLETLEPTGILYGMNSYISTLIPPLGAAEMEQGVRLANAELVSHGVTSFEDATVTNGYAQWVAFRKFKERRLIYSRITLMFGSEHLDDLAARGLAPQAGDEYLRLGAVKLVVERTDGVLRPSQAELNEMVLRVLQAGFSVAIHAVDEAALDAACTALEYALSKQPRSRLCRIEHGSVCPPGLLDRLARLPASIVTQPAFLFHSGERYLATVEDRERSWLYRIKSFLEAGLIVAGSSDAPVVPADPIMGVYASVTRRAENGDVVLPDQAITARQALQMYTSNGAQAIQEGAGRGSIEQGKLADLVLLSADPVSAQPETLSQIQVDKTIIGGRIVWERENG